MDELQQKMDDMLNQSASITDPAQRKESSDDLQLFAMEQYWKFPIYWEQEAVAFWPEIRGYFHHPAPSGPHIHWEQLWYDPAHKDDSGLRGQITGVPGGL
jgi:hypothetical protein